jgi:peptide/nickel transport system permease protein
MHSRRLWLAVSFLVVLHLAVLLAGFFAPYDPGEQDRFHAYAPPTRVHFHDERGLRLSPFVRPLRMVDFGEYAEDMSAESKILFFCQGAEYSVVGLFRSSRHLYCADQGTRVSLLGTDAFGRDVLSRLLFGAQISLGAGLLATLVSLSLGLLIGMMAGYRGGWADEVLMGASELLVTLPWLYLLFALRAFLPLHLAPAQSFLLVVGVVALLGWARPARLVRGVVLSAKTRNYVTAARGFGASELYIVRRHILPAVAGVMLTQAALLVPQYVAAEVSLSFFALGVSEPTPSWGNMLAALQQYQVLTSYAWMLAPAAALCIVSVTYCFLADTLQMRLQSR